MSKNTENFNNDSIMETFPPRFPLNRLETNWPFSMDFTRDFFRLNKSGYYSSLEDFLISVSLPLDIENSSSSDEDLEKYKNYFRRNLKYKEFFIEDNNVFFKESVKKDTRFLEKNELEPKVYSLNNIPYETLVYKNSLFYIDFFIKGKEGHKTEK